MTSHAGRRTASKSWDHNAARSIVVFPLFFKKQQPSQTKAFKAAQQNQSPETRQLVAAMKG